MGYYPVFLDLEGTTVLVVGGGRVAERKIETLLQYGAEVHVVSRELTGGLDALIREGRIRKIGDTFDDGHLEGVFLVIAATDDRDLNHRISLSARKRGLLVNAVDQPVDCNFIVPSIVRRGDLVIAVSTSGKSPAMARKLREALSSRFGPEYAVFLELMGRLRQAVLSRGFTQEKNRRIFQGLVDSDILQALAANDWEHVASMLREMLPGDLFMEIRSWLSGRRSPGSGGRRPSGRVER